MNVTECYGTATVTGLYYGGGVPNTKQKVVLHSSYTTTNPFHLTWWVVGAGENGQGVYKTGKDGKLYNLFLNV